MNRRPVVAGAAALAVLTVVGPLAYPAGFGSTDVAATEQVLSLDPGYRPWMTPVWTPGTPLAETLLFGVQAVIGLGLVWYSVDRLRTGEAS